MFLGVAYYSLLLLLFYYNIKAFDKLPETSDFFSSTLLFIYIAFFLSPISFAPLSCYLLLRSDKSSSFYSPLLTDLLVASPFANKSSPSSN